MGKSTQCRERAFAGTTDKDKDCCCHYEWLLQQPLRQGVHLRADACHACDVRRATQTERRNGVGVTICSWSSDITHSLGRFRPLNTAASPCWSTLQQPQQVADQVQRACHLRIVTHVRGMLVRLNTHCWLAETRTRTRMRSGRTSRASLRTAANASVGVPMTSLRGSASLLSAAASLAQKRILCACNSSQCCRRVC